MLTTEALRLEMKKMWKLGRKRKSQRTDGRTPLMDKNNNDIQDENYEHKNPLFQNTLNSQKEQRQQSVNEIKLQELAEILGVTPDANSTEDGSCCSMQPETSSGRGNLKQSVVHLIQRSVSEHFPKPPADLDKNLQRHLLNLQETVCKEIVRLSPLLNKMGLTGCLIDCYHRQTCDHLNDLLENICSTQNSLLLMKWVLHTYLSQELLNHPELQEMDPIKKVDLLLVTEWVAKANNKMLENVQKEVRGFLEKILQFERGQKDSNCEEACVRLYVDTIQCIEAMPKEAQQISSELSDRVREACFQELLTFLKRYTTEQTDILEEKAKMDEPETLHFFKTLITCKKLKQHVQSQTKSKGIKRSLLQETVATLENMEAVTLKLLMDIVAGLAESHLKNYFKTENRQFFCLMNGVTMHFPKLLWCQDIQKGLMDEAYKHIVHIYLKNLVRSSQSKLTKCWSPNVGQTVTEDAELLHRTMSDLAPGVQQWNLMLLKIEELLECTSIDSVKLTVASMQQECLTWSEDLVLLPALLRWNGLSVWQVREVLEALPGQEPGLTSASWYSCLTCW